MASFYTALYETFWALIPKHSAHTVRFQYPGSGIEPCFWLEKDGRQCAVTIPRIRFKKSAVEYGRFAFPADEFGFSSVGRLALASTALVGAKAIEQVRYGPQIAGWLASKDHRVQASYAVNSVMDKLARSRIGQLLGHAFYENAVRAADMMSICALPKIPLTLESLTNRTMIVTLRGSREKLHGWPAAVTDAARAFAKEIDEIKMLESERMEFFRKGSLGSDGEPILDWAALERISERLYEILKRIPFGSGQALISHLNELSGKFSPEAVHNGKGEGARIISEEQMKLTLATLAPRIRLIDDGAVQLVDQLVKEQVKAAEIKSLVLKASAGLHFDSYEPSYRMDYRAYEETCEEVAPQIRTITERISAIKYVIDEEQFRDAGNVDLQIAIQAIAAETTRNDMFIQEEDVHRSEAWTLLLDSSKSLEGSNKTLRALAVCLAETAMHMIGPKDWAMFAFSDRISCLKYYDEPYDFVVKSKLGGLRQGGLTHSPDALRLARNIAASSSSNAKDKNYVILITDGLPAGYIDIEGEFLASVKEILSRGFKLGILRIGAGRNNRSLKTWCVEQPADIVKAFVELYQDLSA